MSLWSKIKKGATDTKDSAGKSMEYTKGKVSGFKHPDAVDAKVQVCHTAVINANMLVDEMEQRTNSQTCW